MRHVCAICGKLFKSCVICGRYVDSVENSGIPNMCRECRELLKGPLVYSSLTTEEAVRLAQQHFRKRQGSELLLRQAEKENTQLRRENRKMKRKIKRKRRGLL